MSSVPFSHADLAFAAEQRHLGRPWRSIAADLGLGRDDVHALILAVHAAYPRLTVSLDGPEGDA